MDKTVQGARLKCKDKPNENKTSNKNLEIIIEKQSKDFDEEVIK